MVTFATSQPFAGPPLCTPEFVYRQVQTRKEDILAPRARPTPQIFNPAFAFSVRLHLDDPLLHSLDLPKLVSLCAIADAAIERVQKLPQSAEAFDVTILQQIEAVCNRASTKEPIQVNSRYGSHPIRALEVSYRIILTWAADDAWAHAII